MAKTTILIIGGGAAGVSAAKEFSKALDSQSYNVQLVTTRDFYIHTIALPRILATTEGRLEEQAFLPYDNVFEQGRPGQIIIGTVDRFEGGNTAVLADGSRLPFDYLVLATGTQWEGPIAVPPTRKAAQLWVDSWRERISQAQRIVLIGGGAVGYELAGEIKHFSPNKTVSVIHGQPSLLNGAYPDKFRNKAKVVAEKKGVQIFTGEKVLEIPEDNGEPVTVVTDTGRRIEADLVIRTRGGRPVTDFIQSLDSSVLTPAGRVKVEPTLQVKGHPNIYASGDIIDWNEQKQLAKIPGHTAVVVNNLLKQITGNQKASFKSYSTAMEGIALPLGPTGGVGYLSILGGVTLGNWMTKTMKSKGLFIRNAQVLMGVAK